MNLLGEGNSQFTALIKCLVPITEFLGEKPDEFLISLKCQNKRIQGKYSDYRLKRYNRKIEIFEQFTLNENEYKTMLDPIIHSFLKELHSNFIAYRGKDRLVTEFLVNFFIDNKEQQEVNKFNLIIIVPFYFRSKIMNRDIYEKFLKYFLKEENFFKYKRLLSKKLKDLLYKRINNKYFLKDYLEFQYCNSEYHEYIKKCNI